MYRKVGVEGVSDAFTGLLGDIHIPCSQIVSTYRFHITIDASNIKRPLAYTVEGSRVSRWLILSLPHIVIDDLGTSDFLELCGDVSTWI